MAGRNITMAKTKAQVFFFLKKGRKLKVGAPASLTTMRINTRSLKIYYTEILGRCYEYNFIFGGRKN